MTIYVASTIIITEWRNKFRRLATEADDAFNQKAVDALLNFETVMYFNAQDHISDVYDQRHAHRFYSGGCARLQRI